MGKLQIFFKKWTPLFDAQRERLEEIPMWVHLSALAPQLWLADVFISIGNKLGTFLEVDMSFFAMKERKVDHILVKLDLREGLTDNM